MKKIIALAILGSFAACTPYQKLFLHKQYLKSVLEDSCDAMLINSLKKILDTVECDQIINQDLPLGEIINDSGCEFFTYQIFPPHTKDSVIWLTTIRPVVIGKDSISLGNIYTFEPEQDSSFIYQRRIKEYTQKADFESGKYMVFTYFVENDTINIIKVGKHIF